MADVTEQVADAMAREVKSLSDEDLEKELYFGRLSMDEGPETILWYTALRNEREKRNG